MTSLHIAFSRLPSYIQDKRKGKEVGQHSPAPAEMFLIKSFFCCFPILSRLH
uniref:Uncharacterized protein n=1 Tax=Caudovirales sp. ctCVG11 TaxID=2825759 RepID=A0A8S5UAU7_9CAUD|nr:MAG TPA: hypothetical protein [Caudovirales sp. ctCVG11]DAV68603.1 MAG TPA: hypothetical protein [Bacteriophage sp.]